MPIPMPDVDEDHNLQRLFTEARRLSRGEFLVPNQPEDQRYLAIITPGRHTASVHCPLPAVMTPKMIKSVRDIVPEEHEQAVTVIADTRIPEHGKLALRTVAERMPFLGYLLGIAFVGHTVVVFEGHPSALVDGCRGADLLIVDEERMDSLQQDWMEVAASVMRRPRIMVVTRDGTFLAVDPPAKPEELLDDDDDDEADIEFDGKE